MSQLQTVLRRSVAHLDPSDHDGRERVFTSAREAMIRLLWSYDPPLTPSEIDSKIDEFDGVVAEILGEDPAEDGDPAKDDADDAKPSSLVTPEPGVLAKPDALPFSTALALPPREPMRKLARIEPLSQIGSPTPGKSDAAARPAAAPSADAAVFEALAALNSAAGSDKTTGRRDSAIATKSTQPAAAKPATEGWRPEEEEGDDEETSRSFEEPEVEDPPQDEPDEDLDDDRLPEDETDDRDDDASDDEPLDEDDREDEDAEANDDDLDDEDEEAESDGHADRESADDILRRHRERFDDRVAFKADPRDDADVEEELDDEPLDRDEPDEEPFDDEEPRRSLGERLRDATSAISGRMIGVIAGVILLLVAGLGGAAFLFSRNPTPATTTARTEPAAPAPAPAQPAPPTDIAGVIAAAPEQAPTPPTPAATDVGAGALALETLNLFDGRDPSVFQSLPDNPVRFEGDTQGGFARVSSSTNSTGSRITVGRGVYERLAGRIIRIVVVARGAATDPAHTLRFAYQNGRSLSPWKDGNLEKDYAPLSATWTVPKDRGGPETDAVLIEPGIPGDGTAVDIKSVRIEVLK